MKIQNTRDAGSIQGIHCAVYGRSGVGKTVLCATAPRPIILSAERGLLSLRNTDIPFIQLDTFQDVNKALGLIHSDNRFETICLDSLTEISELCLNFEKSRSVNIQKAYGEMATKMAELVRDFRNYLSHKNIVFICQETIDKISGLRTPNFPGQVIPDKIPYMLDEVFRMAVMTYEGKQHRVLQTEADQLGEAKDRSGALDPLEFPDLTNVFNKIRSK